MLSYATALNCCVCCVTRFTLDGVTTTRLTAGAAVTVIDADAVWLPLDAMIDVVPTAAPVTVVVAPVVGETVAVAEFADDHVTGAAMTLFDAS